MSYSFTEESAKRISATVIGWERRNNRSKEPRPKRVDRHGGLPAWDVILNEDIGPESWGEAELLKTDRNTRSGETLQIFNATSAQLDEDSKGFAIPVCMIEAPEDRVRWYFVPLTDSEAQPFIDATTDEDINPDSSGNATLRSDGTTTVVVHLDWIHGGQKVSAGKRIRYRWDGTKNVIMDADCE